ncbi:MAG: hypothetical protein RL600_939 [Actinomycetota bacterium]
MNKLSRRRVLAGFIVFLLLLGGAVAYANKGLIRAAFEQLQGNDFPGPGTGEVEITVKAGDSGESITKQLLAAGVIKNFRTTYQLILDTNPTFYPGIFTLKLQMRSADAISALTDQNSASLRRTTIKEGLRASVLFGVLAESTGLPKSQFESLFNKPEVFGLSADLPNIEGYLFPATYAFAPGSTAKEILQTMVDRMQQEIRSFGIPAAKTHEVLTLASVIQKEARIKEDFYRVSRTFLNRIEIGMHLQSDATVSYGVGGNTVSTSRADRANKNGYNTYLYPGLPIGPISAPGSVAIDAALNPAQGKWLYFCTVNLETGETVFSETYAQHEKAVAQWLAWMKENPGYE